MKVPREARYDAIALMGALCLFFSTLEYLIPKPVPFFRLGLANLPILLSLSIFTPADVLLLVALKVIGQGLVNGTLASYVFLFSAAGSLASVAVMLVVHRFGSRWVTLIGVGVFGALASNSVQITLSVTFIFGDAAWVIAPLFLGIGVASGFMVGLVAERFRARSRWLGSMKERYRGP
ncbi:MAG: Gx transporter family protein [Spirochaetales bacterium]|nr:Gx transporter family protein [Spirochaetales bacterium]